ncbi:MAG: LysR family transcriptional regulator [Gammaproteobacteria bacterium]|jgi:DNA-binding transcriptional LysR family regulator
MLRVTLEQWRMFLAVVKYGGFNKAAKHIHKSQSSIHHAVSKIETSLGVNLFDVEGRTLHLTDAGHTLHRRAEYLVAEAGKIETVGKGIASGIETEVKLAVDGIFPQDILGAVLESLSNQFPDVRLELHETVLSGARELLENGEVDIAIGGQPLTKGWNQPLLEIDFVPVASPDHPLTRKDRSVTYEDLKSYRQIVVRDSATDDSKDDGWLEAEQRWTVSHLATSIRMIKSNHGFAWLPISLIQGPLDRGELAIIPMSGRVSRTASLFLSCKDWDGLGIAAKACAESFIDTCADDPRRWQDAPVLAEAG